MIYWILQLLVHAAVLFLLSGVLKDVKVRSYGTAVVVALVIGLLNATIGVLIRFPLNLLTLWLFAFLVRLIVTALMIKLADKLFSGFDVRTFTAAFLLALGMALAGSLLDSIYH